MLRMDEVVSIFTTSLPEGTSFQPSEINLTDYFVEGEKVEEHEEAIVTMDEAGESLRKVPISPVYPKNKAVVAIDSTGFCLGYIPEGVVGAVRASVVVKPAGLTVHRLERYGPYLVPITNQNKDSLYRSLCKAVYGKDMGAIGLDCMRMIDAVRNFLERHIQFEVVRTYEDALILLDGSLATGVVYNPEFYLRRFLDHAAGNHNSIAAISKSTRLTLRRTQRSVLSLVDGAYGPCCVGGVRGLISGKRERYMGEIYVAKLTTLGEPFKIDLPENAPMEDREILASVAGLAGEYGYPEELKLAHMTCILGILEIIELQAAAIALYGLNLKEELRRKLFPL